MNDRHSMACAKYSASDLLLVSSYYPINNNPAVKKCTAPKKAVVKIQGGGQEAVVMVG